MKFNTLLILCTFFAILTGANSQAQSIEKNMLQGSFNLFQAELAFHTADEKHFERIGQTTHIKRMNSESSTGFGLSYVRAHFLIPELFSIGIGANINYYGAPSMTSIPVYLDFRFYGKGLILSDLMDLILNEHIYFNFKYGKAFNLSSSYNNSNYYKVSVGWLQNIDVDKCLVFDIGFTINPISLSDVSYKYAEDTLTITGLQFSVGLMF